MHEKIVWLLWFLAGTFFGQQIIAFVRGLVKAKA